jgi:hypothetical protein
VRYGNPQIRPQSLAGGKVPEQEAGLFGSTRVVESDGFVIQGPSVEIPLGTTVWNMVIQHRRKHLQSFL